MEPPVIERARGLNDLELALLLSLVAQQHCIIGTRSEAVYLLTDELAQIASRVFGLSSAVLECSKETSLDDFGRSILVDDGAKKKPARSSSPKPSQSGSYFQSQSARHPADYHRRRLRSEDLGDGKAIANVVIVKDLDRASVQVQIQALELMRTKRVYSHTEVHSAPKRFILIAVLSDGCLAPRFTNHLNDQLFMSHFHSPDDGFDHIETVDRSLDEDGDWASSIAKNSHPQPDETEHEPLFSEKDIDGMIKQSQKVSIAVEMERYLRDIVVFLRMHRAVGAGITAQATQYFDLLVKCLAPLHSLTYATPSLVALAAKKIYPHRIRITKPEEERSMQYGSEIQAVATYLEGVSSESVIDDVLGMVEVPL